MLSVLSDEQYKKLAKFANKLGLGIYIKLVITKMINYFVLTDIN